MMEVDVVRAWPRRCESRRVCLPEGACVIEAVAAAGWTADAETVAYAVHGVRVASDAPLRDGDRVELLRPLLADPKEARRRRAGARTT
jgi:putative ubiquitin-RnfH superfamily antitoxin RatB of RatAB toxin-antitoxin module